MIYDIWYLINDIWYMIFDIWYMIFDTWYLMYDQRKLGSNLLSYGQIELWYLTSQNNRCTQGGVRLYITNNTSHNITSQNTTSHNNTSNNNTSREVVAMTKGGDEGKWWRREVVTWGSDDSGKWWPREVVTQGSGDEGSGDDEGKWWASEVVTLGSGDCSGCMNVAWDSCWGGSRRTKPCAYPCKVASAGDERYLVCAAGAAALVSSSNRFLLCVLQRVVVRVCVVIKCFGICGCWCCKTHCHGCMIVACGLSGRKPEHETVRFSLWSGLGRWWTYLVRMAGAAAIVSTSNPFSLGVLQRVVVHVCVLLCACWIFGNRSPWMAVWLLPCSVAMCVERCGLATWCCKTHCNGCVYVAWRRGCVRNTIVFCSWTL